MDVRYINPFVSAIENVFKTMLGAEIVIGKPILKSNNDPHADISALIGYTGNVSGSVTLCFSKHTALNAVGKLIGQEVSEDDTSELADALGELANMVAGQAKASLPESGIAISLPRVVRGSDHVVLNSDKTPVILLRCDCELGRFSVEVMVETKKPADSTDASYGVQVAQASGI